MALYWKTVSFTSPGSPHWWNSLQLYVLLILISCSQWPRGLRCRSVTTRLLRIWVRIPPAAWMFVCCECCGLSGRSLCNKLITYPEESCRLWCVIVCDLETLWMRRPWPTGEVSCQKQTNKQTHINYNPSVSCLIVFRCIHTIAKWGC
jgi:hypothetical protein